MRELAFARGDHGGNTIGLITAPSLQALKNHFGLEKVQDLARLLLQDDYLGCDQVGLIGDRGSVLCMSRADGKEIPVCGGVVQVYGTYLRMASDTPCRTALHFTGNTIPLEVEPERVLADMTAYAGHLKNFGCQALPLLGPTAYQAGHILVLSTRDIPSADKNGQFADPGTKLRLAEVHERFARIYAEGAHALVYYSMRATDTDPGTGAKKVHVDACFPHGIMHGFSEPSCGTGSIALALALNTDVLVIHCGGSRWALGGPAKAHVLKDTNGRYLYWHDSVKVTTTGKIHL